MSEIPALAEAQLPDFTFENKKVVKCLYLCSYELAWALCWIRADMPVWAVKCSDSGKCDILAT